MNHAPRRPVIGITAYYREKGGQYYLPASYVKAVRQAGGLPLILPAGEEEPEALLELVDGVIFSGGGDIDVDFYGGEPHPTIRSVDRERDRFELALARLLYTQKMPVLGICRGQQLLAVASGGRLIPHLQDEVGEAVPHLDEGAITVPHPVELLADSRLAAILGTTALEVPSWHHQAARGEPPDWRVVGWSPDGIIEAMERPDHPWMIAVQWHPERAAEGSPHARLFASFVAAAQRG